MDDTPISTGDGKLTLMQDRITDEIFFALLKRKTGLLRRLFGRLVAQPASRFSRVFAAADEAAGREGLPAAGQSLVDDLAVQLTREGAENIPQAGPLLVVANHPGAYDSAALCASIPRRDLKIIAYEIPFYRVFPHISQRMIFVTDDSAGRMLAIRQAVQHLQEGGAILQFGTGRIDPDPLVAEGAESALADWLPSIEIMLRKVQQTRLVLAIASGVLLRRFANHPLTRIHRDAMDRRRLAEFMQVIQQLLRPRSVLPRARLSFSTPIAASQLLAESGAERLMPAIIRQARQLLASHLSATALGG